MPDMVDIVIRNGLVITQDHERRILNHTDIAIKDGLIAGIGSNLSLQAKTEINGQRKAVMPGLVNAHMHETLTRGICEDLPLNRWLDEICFPLDRSYTHEIMQASALMSQLEMIRGGTTTFLDIYRHPDAAAEIALQSGLRAVFMPQIIISSPGAGETVESAHEFITKWKNQSPLITPGFGPHAPYSVPLKIYTQLAELAERHGVHLHTHLSETPWENELIQEQYGCSPTEMLYRSGCLSSRLSVAHGVCLNEMDLSRLVENEVSLVYNPSSNMKLASGIARIPDYHAAGLNVGLGTDSNLSNNNLDMFEEMRLGAVLQKLSRCDATVMPVQKMIDMATCDGARALGLDHQVGSLEIGKQADIILIDLSLPHLMPLIEGKYQNIKEHIVYSAGAGDVSHTIVAGKILMADRQVLTLDIDAAYDIVQDATTTLMRRAGL